uniref:Conserved hypothetical plastid protein n=1 Tax=Caulacanthus okamurae TaxID=152008 RepID=A0A6H1U8N8_9FLOR|nr:conserved hypothetical plastid protein [Caulacanthus okamurae]QIZ74570.1 conserved hypothetical plastid protein [Caulacanthus okamurae]
MLKIYLLCLTCFLLPVCFLITLEIYKTLKNHIVVYYSNNSNSLNSTQAYIRQKKWLTCIKILEKNIALQKKSTTKYYNILGFCYYYINEYQLSEYYYEQVLKQKPNNISILYKLAKVYLLNKKDKDAKNIYQKILKLDKNNNIAKKK